MLDLTGLDRLRRKLDKVEHLDATPFMATAMNIISEDNRRGVLAGTDKDGGYMLDVTYRPVGKAKRTNARQRNNVKGRTGAFGGFGPMAAGLHNNLTSAEYRRLAGKPLAPRGAFSRVVTNLRTAYEVAGRVWTAYGAWFDVVDAKGRPFLKYHFKGAGRLPVRDLAGLRPEGRKKARRAFVAWASDQIRWHLKNGG